MNQLNQIARKDLRHSYPKCPYCSAVKADVFTEEVHDGDPMTVKCYNCHSYYEITPVATWRFETQKTTCCECGEHFDNDGKFEYPICDECIDDSIF